MSLFDPGKDASALVMAICKPCLSEYDTLLPASYNINLVLSKKLT